MATDPTKAGRDVGRRLRDLMDTLGRYDRFVFTQAPAPAKPPLDEADVSSVARAFVLRALHAASEPAGWQLLDRLRLGDATTAELAEALGCSRVIAWDLVDQLVQVGLLGRDMERDRVGITEAGCALVEFVDGLTVGAAREVQR